MVASWWIGRAKTFEMGAFGGWEGWRRVGEMKGGRERIAEFAGYISRGMWWGKNYAATMGISLVCGSLRKSPTSCAARIASPAARPWTREAASTSRLRAREREAASRPGRCCAAQRTSPAGRGPARLRRGRLLAGKSMPIRRGRHFRCCLCDLLGLGLCHRILADTYDRRDTEPAVIDCILAGQTLRLSGIGTTGGLMGGSMFPVLILCSSNNITSGPWTREATGRPAGYYLEETSCASRTSPAVRGHAGPRRGTRSIDRLVTGEVASWATWTTSIINHEPPAPKPERLCRSTPIYQPTGNDRDDLPESE